MHHPLFKYSKATAKKITLKIDAKVCETLVLELRLLLCHNQITPTETCHLISERQDILIVVSAVALFAQHHIGG